MLMLHAAALLACSEGCGLACGGIYALKEDNDALVLGSATAMAYILFG